MKKTFLQRQWGIEDKLKRLDDEVQRLLAEMYKDPNKAIDRAIEISKKDDFGLESVVEALEDNPRSFGSPRAGRIGKKSLEARKKFHEDRKQLVKVMRDIPYEQGRLELVKKEIKEIDRANGIEVEENAQAELKTEKATYDVEREANNTSISDEKAKELKAQKQAKIMQELKEMREQQELERDDDDLER